MNQLYKCIDLHRDLIQPSSSINLDVHKHSIQNNELIDVALVHINNNFIISTQVNPTLARFWKLLNTKTFTHAPNLEAYTVTHRTQAENILFTIGNALDVLRYTSTESKEAHGIEKKVQKIMSDGYHITGIAVKPQYHSHITENDLRQSTWLGTVSVKLKPTMDGIRALNTYRDQQYSIKLLSHDALTTCKAVASAVGLFSAGELFITGHEMQTMSDQELMHTLPHTTICAELNELDTMRIKRLLKTNG